MYQRFTNQYDDIEDDDDMEVTNLLQSRYGVTRNTMKRLKEYDDTNIYTLRKNDCFEKLSCA